MIRSYLASALLLSAVVSIAGFVSAVDVPAASATFPESVEATADTTDRTQFGIPGERVVRIRGMFQSNIEYSSFKPCSEPGGPWWLRAPDDFWAQVYAFSPDDYIEQWDPSEVVEIDVTAKVEVIDDPNWEPSSTDFRGFGHGNYYPGQITVLETHSVELRDDPDSPRPVACP